MVTGRQAGEVPIAVEGVCAMEEFAYLRFHIAASGRMDSDVERRTNLSVLWRSLPTSDSILLHLGGCMDSDVERRTNLALKAFGALRKEVMLKVYQASVLSVLLFMVLNVGSR
jgi:hypothetical protein